MNSVKADFSTSMMTPPLSPDQVVVQRGRRKIPVIFHPDIDLDIIHQNKLESPTKLDYTNPNKSSIILRSTPRKRLLMSDPLEVSSSEKYRRIASSSKKLSTDAADVLPEGFCLSSALKAMTSDQLISIIGRVVINHPDVEKKIRSQFPMADLKPHEDYIYYLRRNIQKDLPKSRLVSVTDSTAYTRVATHILTLKKYVIDQGRRLIESEQWPIVMEYVFMAWKHVRGLPIWDSVSHNAARRHCFKSLSTMCMTALKQLKESLNQQTCENYKNQLKFLSDDHEDMKLCLQLLNQEL